MKNLFKNRKSVIAGVLACLMCLSLLAGCGSSKKDEPAAAAVKDTLVVGCVDPQFALDMHDCTQTVVMKITDNICDSLYRSMADGSLVPILTTGMPEVSEDNLTFTFELKEGIKFHNGATLTAEDVKYSLYRVVTLPTNGSLLEFVEGYEAAANGEADELAGVEVIDDLHFAMHLKTPYTPLIGVLATPYMAIYPAEACKEAGDKWGREVLIGTGPYKLDSSVAGQGVELSVFEDYHGEQPYFKHITYKFIEDTNSQVLEFKQGTIDYCDMPTDLYINYSNDPTVKDKIGSYSAAGGYFVVFNCRDIPDVNVRHALSISIDRNAICNAIMQGTASPAISFLVPGLIGYNADVEPFEYNPEKAKELLAEAGYEDGFDLTIYCGSKSGKDYNCIVAWQEQAKAIGINIDIQLVDNAQWTDIRGQGKMMSNLASWYYDYMDPDSMLFPVHDSRADKRSFFFHDEEFKTLLEEGVVETDPAKRQEMYERAEQILTREQWAVAPLYNETKFYLLNPAIKGLQRDSANRYFFCEAYMEG